MSISEWVGVAKDVAMSISEWVGVAKDVVMSISEWVGVAILVTILVTLFLRGLTPYLASLRVLEPILPRVEHLLEFKVTARGRGGAIALGCVLTVLLFGLGATLWGLAFGILTFVLFLLRRYRQGKNEHWFGPDGDIDLNKAAIVVVILAVAGSFMAPTLMAPSWRGMFDKLKFF